MSLPPLEELTDLKFDGIDWSDFPKFCDVYVSYALYQGMELPQEMLDELNDEHQDWVSKAFALHAQDYPPLHSGYPHPKRVVKCEKEGAPDEEPWDWTDPKTS